MRYFGAQGGKMKSGHMLNFFFNNIATYKSTRMTSYFGWLFMIQGQEELKVHLSDYAHLI